MQQSTQEEYKQEKSAKSNTMQYVRDAWQSPVKTQTHSTTYKLHTETNISISSR